MKVSIPFKAANTISFPIITLFYRDSEYNFILDTGSSTSVIDKACLEDLDAVSTRESNTSIGIEGTPLTSSLVEIVLYNETGLSFMDEFAVMDLEPSMSCIKDMHDIQVHGLLGNTFFERYEAVIDYKTQTLTLNIRWYTSSQTKQDSLKVIASL